MVLMMVREADGVEGLVGALPPIISLGQKDTLPSLHMHIYVCVCACACSELSVPHASVSFIRKMGTFLL